MNIVISKNKLKEILKILISITVFSIFDYIGKNNYDLKVNIGRFVYTVGDINYTSFAIIILMYGILNIKVIFKNIKSYLLNLEFFIWSLYSICVMISVLINFDTPARIALYLLCVPTILFIVVPNRILNNIHLLGISLVIYNVVILSYYMLGSERGISNSMGIILVTSSVGWISLINSQILQKRNILFSTTFILINGVAISLTSSRTAFVAFVAAFVSTLSIILILKSNRKAKLRLILLSILLVYAIIFFKDLWYEMFSNIIDKFLVRSEESNMLSGREDIWNLALSNIKPFGNGSNFFLRNGFLHGHNSFIAILGIDGLLALIIFIIFQIKMIFESFKYYKEKYLESFSIIPLLVNGIFLLISMTEDIWYRPYLISMHLLWFLCNGIVITYNVKNKL